MKSRVLIRVLTVACATILVTGCTSNGPSEPTQDDGFEGNSRKWPNEQIQGIVTYQASGGRTFGQKGHEEPGVTQGGSHGMDESGTVLVMCYPDDSWCYKVDHLGHWLDVREGLIAGSGSPYSISQHF